MPNLPPAIRTDAERALSAAMGLDSPPPERRVARTTRGPLNFGLGERYASAARRVGGLDAQARFAWLLIFAQLPPDEFIGGALIEIREQLVAFALLQGLRGTPVSRAMERLSAEKIWALRQAVEVALRSLSRVGGEWALDAAARIRFRRRPDRSVAVEYAGQNFVELFLWSVGGLVQTHGARLATCAREGCGQMFLRHKRGAYCSVRCSQKVRNDRARAKLSAATRTARRRARYQRHRQQ